MCPGMRSHHFIRPAPACRMARRARAVSRKTKISRRLPKRRPLKTAAAACRYRGARRNKAGKDKSHWISPRGSSTYADPKNAPALLSPVCVKSFREGPIFRQRHIFSVCMGRDEVIRERYLGRNCFQKGSLGVNFM